MQQSEIAYLFDYNYWANARILHAARRITAEQFTAPTNFPRSSLRATLLHVLDAELGWRILLSEQREVPDLSPADFPTLAVLEARWREEELAMRSYLGTLTDEDMVSVMHYTNYQGIPRQRILWRALFQVLSHGMQHRSEAAAMLTDFGQSPGDLDFSFFEVEALPHAS